MTATSGCLAAQMFTGISLTSKNMLNSTGTDTDQTGNYQAICHARSFQETLQNVSRARRPSTGYPHSRVVKAANNLCAKSLIISPLLVRA